MDLSALPEPPAGTASQRNRSPSSPGKIFRFPVCISRSDSSGVSAAPDFAANIPDSIPVPQNKAAKLSVLKYNNTDF